MYDQINGLSNLLKTNLEMGINGDDLDVAGRRNAFGANTYPRKKGRSFWVSFHTNESFIRHNSFLMVHWYMFLNFGHFKFLDVLMGSMARLDSHYPNDSCCTLFGFRHKN